MSMDNNTNIHEYNIYTFHFIHNLPEGIFFRLSRTESVIFVIRL